MKPATAAVSRSPPVFFLQKGRSSVLTAALSLIYSETPGTVCLPQSHDIQAPAGSPVCAAAAGTVTETGKDDRYGSYVLIAHGNGLESRCCCLGDISVAEGDVVNKGDTIGSVGEDALFEKADGPHIHFEVKKTANSQIRTSSQDDRLNDPASGQIKNHAAKEECPSGEIIFFQDIPFFSMYFLRVANPPLI